MIKFILSDVEGTTTSISFVHQTLFPYSRKRMASFLQERSLDEKVQSCLNDVAQTIAQEELAFTPLEALEYWIESDRKHPALKTLQGMIWQEGYNNGEIKGHVYEDVGPALVKWREQGIKLGIYSSGSVLAQKLLFKHSLSGDLDQYFSYNFDTAIGHKREVASYREIAAHLDIAPQEILFLSDIAEELMAAKAAQFQVLQLCREGQKSDPNFDSVSDFSQISLPKK